MNVGSLNLASPEAFAPTLYALSPLAIAAAGLSLMIGYRQFGFRLLAVGVFLPATGALSPMWLGGDQSLITLHTNWLIGCLATVGGSLFILDRKQAGLALAMPAINRFVIIPTLAPILKHTPWEFVLTGLLLVTVLGGPAILRALLRGALSDQSTGFILGWFRRPDRPADGPPRAPLHW